MTFVYATILLIENIIIPASYMDIVFVYLFTTLAKVIHLPRTLCLSCRSVAYYNDLFFLGAWCLSSAELRNKPTVEMGVVSTPVGKDNWHMMCSATLASTYSSGAQSSLNLSSPCY